MRYFLFAIALSILAFVPQAAKATPVDDNTANQYYANCRSQNDPRMSAESQDSMCACNAAMMKKNFTMEDMQLMVSQKPESRRALNKMLLDVYAPCMNFPVYDLLNDNCVSDRKLNFLGSVINVEAFCGCVAKNTTEWLTTRGRDLMREVIRKNPTIYDPITPVMEHPDFMAEAKRNEKLCTKAR